MAGDQYHVQPLGLYLGLRLVHGVFQARQAVGPARLPVAEGGNGAPAAGAGRGVGEDAGENVG